MSLQNLKLYSYYRSSASYRVRIALNLKGLSYEYLPVHLLNGGGEQHSEDYKSLNPSAEVPTLIDGDKALGQSVAICLYLDDVAPEKPLLFSKDPYEKARILQACEIINSGIQPLQNLRVMQKLVKDFGFNDEQKTQWIRHWVTLGFTSFEKLISNYNGPFCMGELPTAADAFLAPQMFAAQRFAVATSAFPKIQKVSEHFSELDAFKMAHPDNQPDTPAE